VIGPIQAGLRQGAEWALARDYPTIERAAWALFRRPSAFPPLDLAGLELAKTLGERASERPIRLRRLMAAAREAGGVPLAVIGDSHSTHLVRRSRMGERWLLPLHRLCTGASARGLVNPEAAAGAGTKARTFLAALPDETPLIFKFGQVDIEFVFTFKRLEANAEAFDEAAFDTFADETVERYLAFLTDAVPPGRRACAVVAGVFPPALSDAAWRQGYVDAHIAALHGGAAAPADLAPRLARLEIPSLAERTRLHAGFNVRLFEAARAAGFRVLDGFDALLGPDGTVKWAHLGRAAGTNHHLGYAASRAPLVEALWGALAEARR